MCRNIWRHETPHPAIRKQARKRKAKWESTNEPNNPNKINIPVLQNCHCHYSRVGFPWFLPISSNQKSSFYYPIWSKIIKRVRKLISTWCWWGVWVWFWLERVLELETRVVKQQAKTLLIFIRTVKKKFQGSLTKARDQRTKQPIKHFLKKKKKNTELAFCLGLSKHNKKSKILCNN